VRYTIINLSDIYFFQTIDKPSIAEFRDRGSKFLAHAFPLNAKDKLKTHLQGVKTDHPKATHYCFAYRIGLDGTDFRVSDDGEPSGSAGRPILGQIDKRELTNILVVVVRYFGGSLLGVPGLINAYKTATSLALQTTPILQKQVEIKYKLTFDYTLINDIMLVVKQTHCTILHQDLQLFCTMTIGIPKIIEMEAVKRFHEFHSLEINTLD